jgi:integrase
MNSASCTRGPTRDSWVPLHLQTGGFRDNPPFAPSSLKVLMWSARASRYFHSGPAGVLQVANFGFWRKNMETPETVNATSKRQVWNAGRTVGAKRALKPKQIWEIRFYLNQRRRLRDRALFDLAIDSKLRGCDLVQLKIGDIVSGGHIRSRAIVMQQKTGRPVQFELLPDARASLLVWLDRRGGTVDYYVFPSRVDHNGHLSMGDRGWPHAK